MSNLAKSELKATVSVIAMKLSLDRLLTDDYTPTQDLADVNDLCTRVIEDLSNLSAAIKQELDRRSESAEGE